MGKVTSNKWFQLLIGLAPLILANIKGGSKIAPIIPVIVAGIEEAEKVKGATTGAEKKAHVLNTVEAGIAAANATGKVKIDAAEVTQLASDGIDVVISAVNLVHDKGGA